MTTRLLSHGTQIRSIPLSGQFAINASTTTGLTLGVREGIYIDGGNDRNVIAVNTYTLTDDTTNWLSIGTGVLSISVGAAPSSSNVLYKIVTASGVITSITDLRGLVVTNSVGF